MRTKKGRHKKNKKKWGGMRTNEKGLKGMRRTWKERLTMWRKGKELRRGRNEEIWEMRRN